jgi:hypothetical protein
MRVLKIIAAILLFLVSLFFLLFSIVAFTEKEIGIIAGFILLAIAVLTFCFGIRLITKLPVKEPRVIEQPEFIPAKMTFLERVSYSLEYFSGQIRKQNERNQKRNRLRNE